MSAMTFSDDMARIQRAVAQCRDIVLRYSQVLEALQLRMILSPQRPGKLPLVKSA
jgi:hypothetical protein